MRPTTAVCAALSLAVAVPAGGLLGLLIWDANTPATGPAQMPDAPGFGLFGMNVMAAVMVFVLIGAGQACVRRDAGLYAALAIACGLVVAVSVLTLGGGLAAELGLTPGRLPPEVAIRFAAIGLYCGALGSGLWWLSRRLRPL